MQIFPRYINTIARVAVFGAIPFLGLVTGTGIAVGHSPYITGMGRTPPQPVPFSHEHHAGRLGIDCLYCHVAVETQPFAGIPDAHTCMSCHSQLFTEADMLAPVREAYAGGAPLAWRRVHDMPDFVYFDHGIHIDRGVPCARCHGDVTTQPLMKQTQALFMQDCLACHRELQPPGHLALTQCSICHR